jgi:protein-disulfide isomerase
MEENTHGTPTPPQEPKKENKLPEMSVPQAIIVNAFIIALSIVIAAFIFVHTGTSAGTAKNTGAAASATSATAAVDIKNVKTAGEPYIGSPNAPVVIAYWSDYQCPFCKQFETTTFQTIVQNYVSTGKVDVVFKDFSFLGPDSDTAAVYARSVWALYPSEFFAWRTAIFNAQDGENTGFGDEASILKTTATVPGIDTAKLSADVAANRDAYQKAVDDDKAEAASFGIEGTPSFITGTKLLQGVQDYPTFSSALDAQLK